MKEDGIIYTVVVKQGRDSPTVPRVSPIFLSEAQCCVIQKFCPEVFTPLFPGHSVPFSARQSRDRGKAGPPSPSFLLHGWLLLHLHLLLHLSHLHLHPESAGHPVWQVKNLYSYKVMSFIYQILMIHLQWQLVILNSETYTVNINILSCFVMSSSISHVLSSVIVITLLRMGKKQVSEQHSAKINIPKIYRLKCMFEKFYLRATCTGIS